LSDHRIVLEARAITKSYGHVGVLHDVDFEVRAGEVMAVVGDNGAGKSTMIKVLSGALQPDRGEILLEGRPVRFASPLEARAHGIETVFQDLAVAPALDIAANLFLGREQRRPGPLGRYLRMLDKPRMRAEAKRHMDELRFRLPAITTAVEMLSGGQRQGVAVARSAAFASRLVIMDEPTAALGVRETGQVLDLIRSVRDRGLAIVLISHNMPNVFEIADRIHVMRLGRRVMLTSPREHSMSDIVALMTGAMPAHDSVAGAATRGGVRP
jgi:fructose transport system ATP-binding protein